MFSRSSFSFSSVVRLAGMCLLAGGAAQSALADSHQTVEWALDAGVGYDTNPVLSNGQLAGSASTYTGGSVFIDEYTPRLKLLVGGVGGYEHYLDGGVSSYFTGMLNARGEYTIIPERLYWQASEIYGQDTANVFEAPSSDNRVRANIFSTGPRLSLPLTDLLYLNAGADVGRASYSGGGGVGDTREDVNLALVHPIERLEAISLQGDFEHIGYPNEPTIGLSTYNASYDIESIYGRWQLRSSRNDMTVDVGESRVVQASKTYQSPTVRVNLGRDVSPHLNLAIVGAIAYTDTASQFTNALINSRNPNLGPVGANGFLGTSTPLVAQPVKQEDLRFVWKYTAPRTTIVGGIYASRSIYLDTPTFNGTEEGASGRITHRMTHKMDLSLSAGYVRRNYTASDISDTTEDIGPLWAWHITPDFTLSASLNYERRTSSYSLYSYNDERAYIGIRWSPFHNNGIIDPNGQSFNGVGEFGAENPFNTAGSVR